MRYAKRTDDNHESVVRALRLILAKDGSVHDLSGAGRGTPDIMVGYQGRNFLFEIKDGTKSPSRRKLTPAQQRFYRGWERACLLRGIDWRRAWETDLIAIRCQRAHTRAQRAVHREWNIR